MDKLEQQIKTDQELQAMDKTELLEFLLADYSGAYSAEGLAEKTKMSQFVIRRRLWDLDSKKLIEHKLFPSKGGNRYYFRHTAWNVKRQYPTGYDDEIKLLAMFRWLRYIMDGETYWLGLIS